MQGQGLVNEIVTGKEKSEVVTDQGVVTENTENAVESGRAGVADTMMRENERGVTEENVETVTETGRGKENIEVATEKLNCKFMGSYVNRDGIYNSVI